MSFLTFDTKKNQKKNRQGDTLKEIGRLPLDVLCGCFVCFSIKRSHKELKCQGSLDFYSCQNEICFFVIQKKKKNGGKEKERTKLRVEK